MHTRRDGVLIAVYNQSGQDNVRIHHLVVIVVLPCGLAAQSHQSPLNVLPASGTTQLSASLEAATGHSRHIWRDTPPVNDDGTVNAYIEISRGDRRKWEFDMRANARAIDRVISEDIGGYPVNYGFVPQTVSYDGDPFDVLVLGPPLRGGDIVRGVIVGLMYMEDEKGIDSKVVLSPLGQDGRPLFELTIQDREQIAEYFRNYKRGKPGKFSKVPGWGPMRSGPLSNRPGQHVLPPTEGERLRCDARAVSGLVKSPFARARRFFESSNLIARA